MRASARCSTAFTAAFVLATTAACGAADDQQARIPNSVSQSAESLVQMAAQKITPGSRATLVRFDGIGRLRAACGERPRVWFEVKLRSADVAVDPYDGDGSRVRTLDPTERLEASLPSNGLQRWHVASSHGDGDRVVTASVMVAPVVGGRGACAFSVQSTRSGRMP